MCVKCFETTKKTNKRNAMKCINKIFFGLVGNEKLFISLQKVKTRYYEVANTKCKGI